MMITIKGGTVLSGGEIAETGPRRARPHPAAGTPIRPRRGTFTPKAEPAILDGPAAGRIHGLAFNDRMEGTIMTRHRPDRIRKPVERTGLSGVASFALADAVHARPAGAMRSVKRTAADGRLKLRTEPSRMAGH